MANVAMPGTVVYSASKAALNQVTRVLAAEVGPLGVRVNSIAPGATSTEGTRVEALEEMREAMIRQTPLGRLGQPSYIARMVVLMAQKEAAWVTGQVLGVSGGLIL